jgi:hypothetical protein
MFHVKRRLVQENETRIVIGQVGLPCGDKTCREICGG